jgi:hypothetical protein
VIAQRPNQDSEALPLPPKRASLISKITFNAQWNGPGADKGSPLYAGENLPHIFRRGNLEVFSFNPEGYK